MRQRGNATLGQHLRGRSAKEKKLRLWKNHTARVVSNGNDADLDGIVRNTAMLAKQTGDSNRYRRYHPHPRQVWRREESSVLEHPRPKVTTSHLQLMIRLKDTKEGPYAHEAKEFLRKLLIGKSVGGKLVSSNDVGQSQTRLHQATFGWI